MTIPRTSLETLEKHWAIDALGQAGRLRAFAISNAWLVKQATGKQLHVSFVDSLGDLALLERAALAYELAALEGVPYLLYPGSDAESSRLLDQAQAAAFQCFQLSQVLPVPEQREKSIFHVLHLAGLAYAADRWNDLRRWIRDQGETIAALRSPKWTGIRDFCSAFMIAGSDSCGKTAGMIWIAFVRLSLVSVKIKRPSKHSCSKQNIQRKQRR